MKVKLYFIGFLILSIFMQSCVLKEEIHVSRKGEIDYGYWVDFSSMMGLMSSEQIAQMLKESDSFANMGPVSLLDFIESRSDKEKNQAKLDSLFKVHPQYKELAKKVKIASQLNKESGKIYFTFKSKDYKEFNASLQDLQELFQVSKASEALNKNNGNFWIDASSEYFYSAKEFKRNIPVKAQEVLESNLAKIGDVNLMQYELKISFDQKIKTVSYQEAQISPDGKGFTMSFNLVDIVKNPSLLQYTVQFH